MCVAAGSHALPPHIEMSLSRVGEEHPMTTHARKSIQFNTKKIAQKAEKRRYIMSVIPIQEDLYFCCCQGGRGGIVEWLHSFEKLVSKQAAEMKGLWL